RPPIVDRARGRRRHPSLHASRRSIHASQVLPDGRKIVKSGSQMKPHREIKKFERGENDDRVENYAKITKSRTAYRVAGSALPESRRIAPGGHGGAPVFPHLRRAASHANAPLAAAAAVENVACRR